MNFLFLNTIEFMPAPAFFRDFKRFLPIFTPILTVVIIIGSFFLFYLQSQKSTLQKSLTSTEKNLSTTSKELDTLKNQDQVKRNDQLQATIKSIENSYKNVIKTYETVQDLKAQKQKTDSYDKALTESLSYLANRNYASAEATLTALNKQIASDQAKAQATSVASTPLANATANNTPPGSGYAIQKVSTDIGEYTVALVAADMGSTRVIVDTASDSDCRDNCPVLSLGEYVSRNGAFAGVNGSYFCPAEYPSCAGKTGSFDLLAMNKNKHYLNSDNNVYSTNPAVIFQNGSMRFVGQASQWGRDTGVDGVLSNYPLLLSGGNIAFSGDGDPKKGSKGNRSFVGNKGGTAYIGVIYNVTVAEGAHVLKSLGLENALNLDSGGSTALWSGGYKAGPGRNIPNAILFVRK
jgi:hypothetical protein